MPAEVLLTKIRVRPGKGVNRGEAGNGLTRYYQSAASKSISDNEYLLEKPQVETFSLTQLARFILSLYHQRWI